jgi:hypothetical protein
LRYDQRTVALTKLYAKNVVKQHARDVILASILLGPSYNEFGIEQIEKGSTKAACDRPVEHCHCAHGPV